MHEQGFKASSTGLVHGLPPEPCVVVILGVAGDLARTTLVPSLYALGCQRLLPEPFALLGVARRAWNDDTFRDAIRTYAQEKKGFSEETWRQFATRLSFVHGDLDAPPTEDYARLREHLKAVQAEHYIPDNVLFHLSVPPQLYGEIAHKLAAASLLKSDSSGWRRLIIEKPFGRDAASARVLDRQLLKVLNEEQIYRVDHYLGKETVQNMLVFRFANPGFEPIWTFCLQPNEGIVQTFLAKQPGPDICLRPVTLHFRYDLTFGITHPPSAYEWLLHDAMQGNQTLFARSDWIYEAWSLVDPVITYWEAQGARDLSLYPAGTWGPEAAEALVARDGRVWHVR